MEKLNILMVDDQPGKLLTYEAMLGQLGENLIKAATAQEALTYLLKEDVAVVLMDVNMPEVSGFELAELIRQHPRCDKTAIIYVSAVHMSDLDRVHGYETGAVDYVSVPVVPEILRAKVSVFIELYRKTMQLEGLNRTLEERVTSRTMALAEADRRKNEFLAMLAHELRNPFQPIRNALELLRQPKTAPAERELAGEIIERQVNHLVRLVDDLLDMSRINSGKLALRKSRVEFSQIVANAIEANRPFAEQRQQKIDVQLPSVPVYLDGDAVRLTQVFVNLMNNAVKFSQPGGHVDIAAEIAEGEVLVRVKDNGMGIVESDLSRIFDIFYQARSPLDGTQGGLGLGLALARQIVEMHGGDISAKSAGFGMGSEFTVHLPVLRATVPPKAAQKGTAADKLQAMSRRILVVDDNRDAAESLATILRMFGNEVDTVFDGAAAVAAIPKFRPDVVLMDIGMPNLDGYQAARAIRMGPDGGEVVLIALTGWGSDVDQYKSTEAGFDRHLVKPVMPTELLEILASVDRRESKDAPRPV